MQNEKMIKATKRRNCSPNKKQKKNIFALARLPDDIIFGVLSWLPATCLFSSMRLVCNPWASIIRNPRFAEMHLRHSKPGVFLQIPFHPYSARFLEIKANGKFEITNLSPRYPGVFVDSVDGLALFRSWFTDIWWVANPVTMQSVEVTPAEFDRLDDYRTYSCGIARAPRSGELKLVCLLNDFSNSDHWYVLRFGLDSTWRKIMTIAPVHIKGGATPLYTGGYLYWIREGTIMVMDVDQETIRMYDSPSKFAERVFHKMGDYLSCGLFVSEYTFEILFLDIDSGSWTCYHRYTLPLNPLRTWRPFFFDVCVDQQLIIYAVGSREISYIAYNMKTQKARNLRRFINPKEFIYVHTNSLLPVNGPS